MVYNINYFIFAACLQTKSTLIVKICIIMETNEKILTGEESLKIITEMIGKTKSNMRQNSFHLLFWGWLIFACSASEYILYNFTDFSHPWYVWFFVIPGVFVSLIYGFVKGRREKVFTYADMVYMWTWMAFMITSVIMFIFLVDRPGSYAQFILLLAGFPTFISGIVIKFRPLIIGGIIFWAFSLVANFAGPQLSSLAMPVAVITGYLIPGYLLRKKVDYEKV